MITGGSSGEPSKWDGRGWIVVIVMVKVVTGRRKECANGDSDDDV